MRVRLSWGRWWSRGRVLVAVVVVVGSVAAAGGCAFGGGRAEPPPEPVAAYQQPPHDVCERVEYGQVLREWELTQEPEQQVSRDYDAGMFRWYVLCRFSGIAEDDRFRTVFGGFRASVVVSLSVYYEHDDAVRRYDQAVSGHIERHADRAPGGMAAEVDGWWDSGVSLELPEPVERDDQADDDVEVTSLAVEWLVRHDNLVVNAYTRALAPTDQADQMAALLHDLVAAMLGESVEPLTRVTE